MGVANDERRAETRLLTNAPIEIDGVDLAGNPFREFTKVRNVSDFGCQFQIQIPLRHGTIVKITPLDQQGRRMPEEPPKLFEIVWTTRCAVAWLAGARILGSERLSDADLPGQEQKQEG
jgi:hypothetical protein